jgi:hypothetical protein
MASATTPPLLCLAVLPLSRLEPLLSFILAFIVHAFRAGHVRTVVRDLKAEHAPRLLFSAVRRDVTP